MPQDPVAHNNLGNALREHKLFDEAIASFRQALSLQPDFAVAHCGLGLALRGADQIENAIASYRKALIYRPDHADACNNQGNALQALGNADLAAIQYRRALAASPNSVEVLNNLGGTLIDSGRFDEALPVLRHVTQLQPNSESAHRNLGTALHKTYQFAEAITCYQQALQLNELSAANHTNLGNALWDAGSHDDAIACFQQAIRLDPELVVAHYNLGNSYQFLGNYGDAIACYRRALELKPDFDTAFSSLLFAMGHSQDVNAAALIAEHCKFGERFEAPWREHWSSHGNTRDPERQLRIGFVSGDLRNHAVALFIEPVFAQLSQCDNLSLHVYHNHAVEDAVSERLRTLVPQWNQVHALDDDKLTQKIRNDRIDILIDLSGHTAFHRLLAFARKPAPLQASWIGYPATTGMQAFDYYFADRFFLPTEKFAPQFTEKIAYLPVNAPFLPFADAPDINTLPALTNGYMTFGSFNRISKISQPVVALWSQLMRALPDSRMLLGGTPGRQQCAEILKWFASEGITESRIDIHPRSNMESYLKLHHRVDLCVDTFPYTGGSTTWQALWMGVPTLTLAGDTSFGRPGAAILGRVGMEVFATQNAREFVEAGIAWAKRLDELASLRLQMRVRFSASAAGQPALVAQGLESVLRTMWRRWCEGLPAAHF